MNSQPSSAGGTDMVDKCREIVTLLHNAQRHFHKAPDFMEEIVKNVKNRNNGGSSEASRAEWIDQIRLANPTGPFEMSVASATNGLQAACDAASLAQKSYIAQRTDSAESELSDSHERKVRTACTQFSRGEHNFLKTMSAFSRSLNAATGAAGSDGPLTVGHPDGLQTACTEYAARLAEQLQAVMALQIGIATPDQIPATSQFWGSFVEPSRQAKIPR